MSARPASSTPTSGAAPWVSGVVGLALLGICIWANTVGALVPIVARRFGIDPAVISAPFITTLVDATGLVIYFTSPSCS